MMKNNYLLVLCLGLLVVSAIPAETTQEDFNHDLVKLTDNLFRLTLDYSLRPNLAVSAGKDGVLLVDTGFAETADKLLEVIRQLDSGEIAYIINTHHHSDHRGANETVKGSSTRIISAKDLELLAKNGVLAKGTDQKTRSGQLFGPLYTLNFNNETIHLIPYPGLHSDNDLLTHFTTAKVAHFGDLLLTQSFPAVGSSVIPYLEFLDMVMEYFPVGTTFIGGHGREYSHSDILEYKKMLQKTMAIVRKSMKAGKSAEQMIQEKILAGYESWGEYLTFLGPDAWINMVTASYNRK